MAADPVVSPADTLRAIVERSAIRGYTAWKDEDRGCEVVSLETHEALVEDYMALGDAAGALLAVGERDKALLAQSDAALTSLEVILFGNDRCRTRDELDKRAEELVAAGERDRRQIARRTEALREVEWKGSAWIGMECCPMCGHERGAGHRFDCTLDAVLADEEDAANG